MQGLLTGDWGYSTTAIKGGMPVTQAISIFFPQTVELAIAATAFATLIGVPTGTVSALRKDKLPDHATRIFALVGYSIPFFWLALLLQILAIAVMPGWEITGGYSPSSISPSTEPWAFVNLGGTYQLFSQPTHFLVLDAALHGSWGGFLDALEHLGLPTATLTIGVLGGILRMGRSGMGDSMKQGYVRTAWARGWPDL